MSGDARMIAAAPDLLASLMNITERMETLVALTYECDTDDPQYAADHRVIADAVAAITKAGGYPPEEEPT